MIIRARELTKYYGDLLAVDRVSFEVREGEVFGFLGPNGAGKTTTIRMLIGLSTPSGGTAEVGGFDVVKQTVQVKERIGVVPEISNLYDELTVEQNLVFAGRLCKMGGERLQARIEHLLEFFQLQEKRKAFFRQLSRGLKRKAVIAAALLHQPPILFLDEPTSGLDVLSARSLRNLIRELNALGTTIFLTTHNIEEADQLCHRVGIIVQGKLVALDTPERLKARTQDRQAVEVTFSTGAEEFLAELKEIPFARQVTQQGDKVRILCADGSLAVHELVKFAEARGVQIETLNTLRPTLEDAFVELTGISSEIMRIDKERGK
ncbi:MAG TPA: ATP-binding cassette domain-containing protein [Armatimonadetes bacterium]|nr:ATP-binding cassette domain-containing protein [Armatimonadota bacterium]